MILSYRYYECSFYILQEAKERRPGHQEARLRSLQVQQFITTGLLGVTFPSKSFQFWALFVGGLVYVT
jgi:hypothetical protein